MSPRWRRRSLAEIRLRAAQTVGVLAERLGCLRASQLTGVEYRTPRLPFGLPDPKAFRARWPQAATDLIDRADRAVQGRFDLLGFRDLDFGTVIDWHLDPIAGKRAPLVHWSRVPFLDAYAVGDHKVVWELNRHQHFVTMGQAYWLTRDEKYAEAFAGQLDGWIENNRPKRGINWASSLEIALRSIAWIWALRLFDASPSLSAALRMRALTILTINAGHIEKYLSTYYSPNTHLTGEALGLLYLGTAFPSLAHASRWRELGTSILVAEMGRQVRPDGVYFEQSTWYQGYTVDFYLHTLLLSTVSDQELPAALYERLERACDVLFHITRPDGCVPLIGDDDGGRLLALESRRPGDYRDSLALAAVLLQRPDYAAVQTAPPSSLAWLMGHDGLLRYASMGRREPDGLSRAFPDGGWYSLRDGWSPFATQMVVNVGPHDEDRGAHAHADPLALELTVEGHPMLIDSGTYTYMGRERDLFRGTAAHNTVTVDGRNTSTPAGRFGWERSARSHVDTWLSSPTFDYLEARHDGYAEGSSPLRHRRAVLWLKGRYWIVWDKVEGHGEKSVAVHFHAALDVTATLESASRVTLRGRVDEESAAGVFLSLLSTGGNGAYRREESWASPVYGARVATLALRYELVDCEEDGITIVTALVPKASSATYLALEEHHAEGGRCWVLAHEEFDDLLLLGGEDVARARDLVSRARLCWVRRTESRAFEFVAVGPGSIDVDGEHLEWKASWAHGRRLGDAWRLETA